MSQYKKVTDTVFCCQTFILPTTVSIISQKREHLNIKRIESVGKGMERIKSQDKITAIEEKITVVGHGQMSSLKNVKKTKGKLWDHVCFII